MAEKTTILERVNAQYSDFKTFIDTLDKSLYKDALDNLISDRIEDYRSDNVSDINKSFPASGYENVEKIRMANYVVLSEQMEKFYSLRLSFLSSLK